MNAATRNLAGRRILLIGIGFYDYEKCIADRLRERGAELTVFEDLPLRLREGVYAAFARRFRWDTRDLVARHEASMLEVAERQKFDQVIVIKGVGLSVPFLKALRERLPAAEFVLYQWDSMARLEGIQERLPLFDRVLTFDRLDALANPSFQFRPLFYRNGPAAAPVKEDLDISFVGWLHSDRLEAIRRMQALAAASGLRSHVYLFTGWLTWFKLLLRGNSRDIHLRPLGYAELMRINTRSRCIYDLPHAAQSGLTMRTIEALGLGKKIVTSATDVIHYDFCSKENVSLIATSGPAFDVEFVRRPGVPVADTVLRRYALDAWLDDVVGPVDGKVSPKAESSWTPASQASQAH